MGENYHDYVRTNTNKWVYCLLGCAGAQLLFGVLSKYYFGALGENVTLRIRKDLYESILRKHIGWFDEPEHSPAVLTSVMAEETSQINGVASDSLATFIESTFAILIGVGIGFVYCW